MEKPTLREILFATTEHNMLIPDGKVIVIESETDRILTVGDSDSDNLFKLELLNKRISEFRVDYIYGITYIHVCTSRLQEKKWKNMGGRNRRLLGT